MLAWREPLFDLLRCLPKLEEAEAEHVAAGVAAFCDESGFMVLKRADLLLLAAKGLVGLRRVEDARLLLEADDIYGRFAEGWLDGFDRLDSFGTLFPCFSRGVIVPGRWAGLQGGSMWILDMGRLVISEEELHEIMVFRSVQWLLEQMAVLWDEQLGEGVLGLRGLGSNAMRRLFAEVESGDRSEVVKFVEQVLRCEGAERAWQNCPDVMVLAGRCE